jgi:hypothetical protein
MRFAGWLMYRVKKQGLKNVLARSAFLAYNAASSGR